MDSYHSDKNVPMKKPGFIAKWWTYQAERFPLSAHGPLILAFSSSAVCYSSLLRDSQATISPASLLVAFLSSLFSFLHLRLADEFKDCEEDTRYRPYRPVPRGLVTLRELGILWAITGLAQALLAWVIDPRLLGVLLLTWVYLGLMSREFFCREWLKARPFTYMWTHMLIMPLVDFYATACDWLPSQGTPPSGLFWFVAASFFNGFVIEIGRKIRAPMDEETGVETYSVTWGRKRAVILWWAALLLAAASAIAAASPTGHMLGMTVVSLCFLGGALFLGTSFLRQPRPKAGRFFELYAGLWTLTLYLGLGVAPWIWTHWR